jgi:hypothetical protein
LAAPPPLRSSGYLNDMTACLNEGGHLQVSRIFDLRLSDGSM